MTGETKTAETQEEQKQPGRRKLTSVKLWVTLWSVGMVSFIVLTDRSEFMTIAQWLCAVPLAYIGANVWQKKIYEDTK